MASPVAGLRVLQLGPLYVEHVQRWAENAAALGCEVHVAGHVRPGRELTDFGEVAASLHVGPPSPERPNTTAHQSWLQEVLAEVRPDLIQAHWLRTWGCFAARSGHPRVAVTPWGGDLYSSQGWLATRSQEALADARRVVALSPHMREAAIGMRVAPERVSVVDLGVDLQRFRPAGPEERARLRRELDLPQGPVVLSLRSGTDTYNLDVVVTAFRQLRLDDATLVMLAGDAPLCAAARMALVRLPAGPRVVERVSPEVVARYMRAADVGVSVPSYDGSPNSVWEALACDLPVVLSDLPQIRDRVAGCAAARLVMPRPAEVARAIEQLAAERKRAASAAREWAAANVDRRDQLPRLERLYGAMATSPAARPAPPAARPAGAVTRSAGRRAPAAAAPPRPS